MKILIVDDDSIARDILAHALVHAGHEVSTAENGRQALQLLKSDQHQLVITDWMMPEMTGIELCRSIRSGGIGRYIYVILITARQGKTDTVEALSAGADDFITKPFDIAEIEVRVRAAQRVLALETRDLVIFAMAKLAESRDPETGAHLERVRSYSRLIAQNLSQDDRFKDMVNDAFVQQLFLTSPLHDIGKVAIPDSVLLKPGRLSDREFEIMKQHAAIGAQTLDAALREHPEAEFLAMARDIAASHHERFDGEGYPEGLKGTNIPLAARIVTLADVYDALVSRRVYKEAFEHEVARSIIVEESGTQFDPDIVEAFKENEQEFIMIRERFQDTMSLAA